MEKKLLASCTQFAARFGNNNTALLFMENLYSIVYFKFVSSRENFSKLLKYNISYICNIDAIRRCYILFLF